MNKNYFFSSESVTAGHPDKLCDQISDAIVDQFLIQDPCSRITAECALSKGVAFIAANFSSSAEVDIAGVARKVIERTGYIEGDFCADDCSILTSLNETTLETRQCVPLNALSDKEISEYTTKNQVNAFGFACNQTPALMPLPIWLANKMTRQMATVQRQGLLPGLSPDGKAQVTVGYRDASPNLIHSLALQTNHEPGYSGDSRQLKEAISELIIEPVFKLEALKPNRLTKIFINAEGAGINGGPAVHSGLTGRKTAIDTYGEYSRNSGSALSGKDPLRMDRIGTYIARYAAKNIVAAGLASACEVQLSYAIGFAEPMSIQVDCFSSGVISDAEIAKRILKYIDFRLASIVNHFDLQHLPAKRQNGFYQQLAAYGHIGRVDIDLPWEQTDIKDLLK